MEIGGRPDLMSNADLINMQNFETAGTLDLSGRKGPVIAVCWNRPIIREDRLDPQGTTDWTNHPGYE